MGVLHCLQLSLATIKLTQLLVTLNVLLQIVKGLYMQDIIHIQDITMYKKRDELTKMLMVQMTLSPDLCK